MSTSQPWDRRRLRIGDAERNQAVESLAQHYAEGRITQQEFDERSAQAGAARIAADLEPLFADLPGGAPHSAQQRTARAQERSRAASRSRPTGPSRAALVPFLLIPLVVAAVVVAAVFHWFPWPLFILFGIFWIKGHHGSCHGSSHRSGRRGGWS